MKKVLKQVVYFLVLALISFGSITYISKLREEIKRVEQNQSQLLSENGELGKQKSALVLKNGELETYLKSNKAYSDLLKDSLKIKTKQVKTLTFQLSKTKIDTVTLVRDSMIYIGGDSVRAKYSEFKNNYVSASVLMTDTAKWHIETVDTVAVAIYDKANFFQRLFGKSKITGSIQNRSPYSHLYLDKVIIKRK
ncbi:MAG: DUF6549 family protein [Bacteroidales bacterium]